MAFREDLREYATGKGLRAGKERRVLGYKSFRRKSGDEK